jgi:hypothetical protein
MNQRIKNIIKRIGKIYIFAIILCSLIFSIIYFSSIPITNNSDAFISLKKFVKLDSAFNRQSIVKDVVSTNNLCINNSIKPAKAIFDVNIKYSNQKELFVRFFMIKDSVEWKVINFEINPKYSIYKGCD